MENFDLLEITAIDRLQKIGGVGLIEKMVSAFCEHTPKKVEACGDGTGEIDFTAVEFASHSLKSSSGTFGAKRLANLCQEIETAAGISDLESLKKLLPQLKKIYVDTLEVLNDKKKEFIRG